MKNHLKLIPVMIYPYIYMLCFALLFVLGNTVDDAFLDQYGLVIFLSVGAVITVYAITIVIVYLVKAVRGNLDGREMIRLTMVMKLVQIPAYIVHFLLGLMGLIMSVWGIGFIIWAIVMDVLMISFTGLIGTAAGIAGCKDMCFSKKKAVLYSVLSFIFCADVVCSVAFFRAVRRTENAA